MKKLLILILLCVLVLGCGSRKRIVTKKRNDKTRTEGVLVTASDKSENSPAEILENPEVERLPKKAYANATEQYIADYSDIAMEEMRKYKIPSSITLAQGILESGSGKGRLSIEGNNHFGIKCHGWTGEKIYHDDDRNQECFRKYSHAKSSFEDHSQFLTGRGRYSQLFDLRLDDYQGWAKGLRAAGYATDRKYPDKLISLIERYNLDEYDAMVLDKRRDIVLPSGILHIVKKGDTLYSLSRTYNTSVDELKRLNELQDNNINLGQTLIIK